MAKTCVSCGKTKPERQFPDDKRTKDGLSANCIGCKTGSTYALDTVDLVGVEIAEADITVHGGGSPASGDTYSVDDLTKIAEDSNAVCADLRPPVKIGHNREQRLLRASGLWDEQPRTGTLKNFRVAGSKLIVDIEKMPRKLADLVESKAFRLRSMELGPARSQRESKTYDTVVKGLALLGTVTPAFQTLDDIHALYAGDDRENTTQLVLHDMRMTDDDLADTRLTNYAVGDVIWDDEDGVQDIMGDVSAALNPGAPDVFPRYWVMDLQLMDVDGDGDVPGPRALVGEYGSGAAWVIPLTFDAEGEPVLAPSTTWVLAEKAWVQRSPDAGAESTDVGDEYAEVLARAFEQLVDAGLTVTEDARYAIREALGLPKIEGTATVADTKGMTPKPDSAAAAKRPDLDESQVAFFAKVYGLEGDDITAEKVYEAIETAASEPEAKPAPEVKPGERTMSESEYAELSKQAAAGAQAAEDLRVEKREQLLRTAVTAGKLDPADKKFYEDRYDKDPEMVRQFIERLPVKDELLRVYGADGTGLDTASAEDEAAYRAYCARNGVPYYGPATSEVAA